MIITSVLACGPSIDANGFFAALAVLFVAKPLAYFGIAQAFRYRIDAPIPMGLGKAAGLAALRTLLGVAVGLAGFALLSMDSGRLWSLSGIGLYCMRAALWGWLGWQVARLRGWACAGWTVSGVAINIAFDVALVAGLLTGLAVPLIIVSFIGAFIFILHIVGRREMLRRRFSSEPLCGKCFYNLTGNVSGICPECGTQARLAMVAH